MLNYIVTPTFIYDQWTKTIGELYRAIGLHILGGGGGGEGGVAAYS